MRKAPLCFAEAREKGACIGLVEFVTANWGGWSSVK